MKGFLMGAALVGLLVGFVSPGPSLVRTGTTGPQTYTVLVGYENEHKGVEVAAFFPGTVTIHAGDTVHWVINTNEVHTVSFGYPANSTLPGLIAPASVFGYPDLPGFPGPLSLVIIPAAAIQVPMGGGLFTAFANSGLMSQ